MPIYVIGAENSFGTRYQLNRIPCDEQDARQRALRAASLLSIAGDPLAWSGGRVVVTDAMTRSLIAVVRIRVRLARKGVRA